MKAKLVSQSLFYVYFTDALMTQNGPTQNG